MKHGHLRALVCLVLLSYAVMAGAQAPDRRIAMTIDDLPWQRIGKTPPDQVGRWHGQLMQQLRAADVPVIGFVNEGKLQADFTGEGQAVAAGTVLPERVAMLRDWLEAGFDLGNHTWGHVGLSQTPLETYQDQILRGERVLRPLLADYGKTPRWFRHPYLQAGTTPELRRQLRDFLKAHGYAIAPVTVDNGEWVWAFAYAQVLETQPPGPAREAALLRLRKGYVPYMLNKLDYFERQSIALLGRNVAQTWLLHANELNADSLAELVAATRRRGYRFIPLDQAMQDPAYQRPDGYTGRYGVSWLHRWAMAEGRPKAFYAGEPAVPRWVMALAGVDGE
jgi:peptidoglycan/xylan/chitin deacetylase (PgdA/CDA1 family)